MKLPLRNPILTIAIAISVLVHGALLAVRFTAPELLRQKPDDPGLEVILVNAKHKKPPLQADVLAQANLDGGGNAESGRTKSPLPDLRRTQDGDSVQATRRRAAELEQAQRKLLTQINKPTALVIPSLSDLEQLKRPPQPDGTDQQDSSKAIARREAEIARNIEEYNKRPKKTQITPNTREVGYAMYYKALQDRVEKRGTFNFPQKDGKKLYGELVLYIPVYQDGTIYERDGGPRVERSSGNPDLDNAALRIVRRAAPFGQFPPNMRSSGKDDVWEIITRFKFTREDSLEAELRGGNN
ncbi:TonB family protein [Actimicrobium sp. CCI2.3]|uniref:TonB family protein n=1 Tax=Actimicrobium sp. CCI2.3 TaxID=3048616 RepID=UPI002AB486EA|nr:TonB family protein [Actimicrobium sp. CCI2.3]MDY7573657.1 TonB family protein [Actimicrobium sp. CCI2.3]MEB0021072.1 TonB family protein [Actimicrobium sp. CCI2.3]